MQYVIYIGVFKFSTEKTFAMCKYEEWTFCYSLQQISVNRMNEFRTFVKWSCFSVMIDMRSICLLVWIYGVYNTDYVIPRQSVHLTRVFTSTSDWILSNWRKELDLAVSKSVIAENIRGTERARPRNHRICSPAFHRLRFLRDRLILEKHAQNVA